MTFKIIAELLLKLRQHNNRKAQTLPAYSSLRVVSIIKPLSDLVH